MSSKSSAAACASLFSLWAWREMIYTSVDPKQFEQLSLTKNNCDIGLGNAKNGLESCFWKANCELTRKQSKKENACPSWGTNGEQTGKRMKGPQRRGWTQDPNEEQTNTQHKRHRLSQRVVSTPSDQRSFCKNTGNETTTSINKWICKEVKMMSAGKNDSMCPKMTFVNVRVSV